MRRVLRSKNHPFRAGFLWCCATPRYLKVARASRWTLVWAQDRSLSKGYYYHHRDGCPGGACANKKVARELSW